MASLLNSSGPDTENECHILQRLPYDLSSHENMVNLDVSPDHSSMSPTILSAVKKLLLLPIGRATVERCFSAMNHILSSQHCRLLLEHACQLMQLSSEGLALPHIHDATDTIQPFGHNRNWPNIGEWLQPLFGEAAGFPYNTKLPGLRPTSMPSTVLIHPAIWPQ